MHSAGFTEFEQLMKHNLCLYILEQGYTSLSVRRPNAGVLNPTGRPRLTHHPFFILLICICPCACLPFDLYVKVTLPEVG